MKTLKLFVLLFLLIGVVAGCKKDTPAGLAQGKMTSTINGKSVSFNVIASRVKQTVGTNSYDYLVVTGISGTNPTASDYADFAISVYATSITAKTYKVPTYTSSYQYDYSTGFAMGMYFTGTNSLTNYYYSMDATNASGSVTITSISSTAVAGTYDMVLTNYPTTTNTMPFKGEFNAKIYTTTVK